MNETIISAILCLVGTLVGTFGGILTSNKLTTYRIEQLEHKVEKHNNLIDRTYTLEKDIAIIKEELKELQDDGH